MVQVGTKDSKCDRPSLAQAGTNLDSDLIFKRFAPKGVHADVLQSLRRGLLAGPDSLSRLRNHVVGKFANCHCLAGNSRLHQKSMAPGTCQHAQDVQEQFPQVSAEMHRQVCVEMQHVTK